MKDKHRLNKMSCDLKEKDIKGKKKKKSLTKVLVYN